MPKAVKVDTLTEQIADLLRAEVLSGTLRAKQRLGQGEIAERFRVSRVPVRDALRTYEARIDALRILEKEGLVDYHPRQGASVTDLSPHDLGELYEMRLALEPLNARLAAPHLTEADSDEMGRHLYRMGESEDDPAAWLEAHADFHRVINRRSGRKRINALLEDLRRHTERYVRLYQIVELGFHKLLAEHQRIHRTVAARDPERLEATVKEHLELVRDHVLDYLESGSVHPQTSK